MVTAARRFFAEAPAQLKVTTLERIINQIVAQQKTIDDIIIVSSETFS